MAQPCDGLPTAAMGTVVGAISAPHALRLARPEADLGTPPLDELVAR